MSSDYTSLKNDSVTQTFTLNIPAVTLTTKPYILSSIFTAGVSGAPMDCTINYSMTSLKIPGFQTIAVENALSASQYTTVINIFRDSATTIKLKVNIYPVSLPCTINARTVTLSVRTFIPPFA